MSKIKPVLFEAGLEQALEYASASAQLDLSKVGCANMSGVFFLSPLVGSCLELVDE